MKRNYVILLLILLTSVWTFGVPAKAQQNAADTDETASFHQQTAQNRLWSVQTGSSRSVTGAIHAVLELRASGHSDAGVLMLFDNNNTLWYIVEIASSENRRSARQAAEAYKQATGKDCFVKPIDTELHASRLISEEGLRNSSLIPELLRPDTTAQPAPQQETSSSPQLPQSSSLSGATESAITSSAITDTPPAQPATQNQQDSTESAISVSPADAVPAPADIPAPTPAQNIQPDVQPDLQTGTREETPEEPRTPFTTDTKQAEIIIARSLFRQGDLEGARSMYNALLVKYGPDEDIREGYTEILIESSRWAEAEAELADWRTVNPESLPALRQTARLYLNMAETTGDYEASFPWLEAILEKTPEDAGVQTDYANARLSAGDWSESLQLFSDIYDKNPDDENAAESIQNILKERGPSLRADYRTEVQAGDVSINSALFEYSQQINSQWRALATHERARLDRRSDEDGTQSIAREIQQHKVALEYEPERAWKFSSGLGYYEGAGEGVSLKGSAERRFHLGGTMRVSGEVNAPWYSSLDAANREGTTDTYGLTYELPLNDNWSMSASAGAERFSLQGLSSYAWQEQEGFSLSRRISYLPDWNIAYIFTRTRQNYRQNNPGDRPLDLVDKEDIHAIRTETVHWYNNYIALRYFASAGYDVFRLSPLLSTGGGLRIRLGERMDIDVGAEYNNDTGQAGGGESKAITSSFIYHF